MTLPYELGEMKSTNGEVLRVEVEVTASKLAGDLFNIIEKYPVYREITEKVGSRKISLYFQTAIKDEIYSIIRDLCVLRWYRRNNVPIPSGEDVVFAPPAGICLLLDQVWPDRDVPMRFKEASLEESLNFRYRSLRSLARRVVDHVSAFYCRWKYRGFNKNYPENEGCIAVQYVEGVDLQRRSDLVWFPASGIDPSRVLMYFAWPDHQPISAKVIKSIEEMGMNYVSLNIHSAESSDVPVWYPHSNGEKGIGYLKLRPGCRAEKWVHDMGRKLIHEINYWSEFYEAFNIKLHVIVGSKDSKYIAQGMAFDRNSQATGLMVGRERSELQWPPMVILGWHPVDVFFIWSPRAAQYLNPNVNHILTAVSAGYSNDFIFDHKRNDGNKMRDNLRAKGVCFTIALFDNVHGRNMGYSTATIEKLYLTFLSWVLDDPTLGLLIKPKKQVILNSLPRVLPVLERAKATGRCIQLEDEFGRLPVDASLASDISVGIGISSAVIESAIAGCRSVHCDLMFLKSHEFYQWGYERIIFDDLDRLITALKGYKSGKSHADLGDWTPFLHSLDPFRDGQAGKRMGSYMRWCLDSFDMGLTRDAVILNANAKYRDQWGADKVSML